ncbi:unnamed protein product [Lathyrus oleraceus]
MSQAKSSDPIASSTQSDLISSTNQLMFYNCVMFKTCIKEARLQEKPIVQLDVSTRWNSTCIMLESALKFQKAFKRLSEKCADSRWYSK